VQPLAVDVNEAAAALGVSSRTIRRMIADGRLVPLRIGRLVRVSVRQLENIAQVASTEKEKELGDEMVQTLYRCAQEPENTGD
jgi:excisionase family DNA binding protein